MLYWEQAIISVLTKHFFTRLKWIIFDKVIRWVRCMLTASYFFHLVLTSKLMKSIFSCCWQKSQIDLRSQVSTNTLNNFVWLLSKSRTVKTYTFSNELTEKLFFTWALFQVCWSRLKILWIKCSDFTYDVVYFTSN